MRYCFWIISFLFLYNQSYSQNSFSIGIKSGYSSSNIHFYNNFFPSNIKTNPLNSFNYSFISEIQTRKNVGLRFEISHQKKGWKQEFLDGQFYHSTINYLNIPILMNAYVGKSRSKLLFSIGPFFDFLLNHDNAYSLLDEDANTILDVDYNSLRDNEFGYGLMASAGISFDFNKNSFQLLTSYQYNLDNLIDVNIKSPDIPDISNFNTLSISLVYLLNFKSSK
jgi:hypothetical protein|tara:strand:- start:1773 stop:2441 length:669 start_codon:yes stop_codon:yes gene_type:complete